MPDQDKLKDEIVKLKLEHIESSLSEFKDTQLRQNERVEKKIDALVSVVSTLETLKEADARQTVEIYQAQKTANEAKEGNKILTLRFDEHEKEETRYKKEEKERISPWKNMFITILTVVLTSLVLGLLALLGFKNLK